MIELRDVSEVVDQYDGLSRTVLDYTLLMKRLVDQAKEPGFTIESWAPLTEILDTEHLVRIGPFKEVMGWDEYARFLTDWATASGWECSFKRVTEVPGLVFLELEERSEIGDFRSVVNTLSVFEFDDAGKIRFLAVYLQMEMPGSGMPEGVESAPGTE